MVHRPTAHSATHILGPYAHLQPATTLLRQRQEAEVHTTIHISEASTTLPSPSVYHHPRQQFDAHTTIHVSDPPHASTLLPASRGPMHSVASVSIPNGAYAQSTSLFQQRRQEFETHTIVHVSDPTTTRIFSSVSHQTTQSMFIASVTSPREASPRPGVLHEQRQEELEEHTTLDVSDPPPASTLEVISRKATRSMIRTPRYATAVPRDLTGMIFTTMLPDVGGPAAPDSFLFVGLGLSVVLALVAASLGAAIWARNRHISLRALLTRQRAPQFAPSVSWPALAEKTPPSIQITLPSPAVSAHSLPKVASLLGLDAKLFSSRARVNARVFGFPASPPLAHVKDRFPYRYRAPPPQVRVQIPIWSATESIVGDYARAPDPPEEQIHPLCECTSAADLAEETAYSYLPSNSSSESSDGRSSDDGGLPYDDPASSSSGEDLPTSPGSDVEDVKAAILWARDSPLSSMSTLATRRIAAVKSGAGSGSDTEGSMTEGEVVTGFAIRTARARSVGIRVFPLGSSVPTLPSALKQAILAERGGAFEAGNDTMLKLSSLTHTKFAEHLGAIGSAGDIAAISFGSSKTLDLDQFPAPPLFKHAL